MKRFLTDEELRFTSVPNAGEFCDLIYKAIKKERVRVQREKLKSKEDKFKADDISTVAQPIVQSETTTPPSPPATTAAESHTPKASEFITARPSRPRPLQSAFSLGSAYPTPERASNAPIASRPVLASDLLMSSESEASYAAGSSESLMDETTSAEFQTQFPVKPISSSSSSSSHQWNTFNIPRKRRNYDTGEHFLSTSEGGYFSGPFAAEKPLAQSTPSIRTSRSQHRDGKSALQRGQSLGPHRRARNYSPVDDDSSRSQEETTYGLNQAMKSNRSLLHPDNQWSEESPSNEGNGGEDPTLGAPSPFDETLYKPLLRQDSDEETSLSSGEWSEFDYKEEEIQVEATCRDVLQSCRDALYLTRPSVMRKRYSFVGWKTPKDCFNANIMLQQSLHLCNCTTTAYWYKSTLRRTTVVLANNFVD